MPFVKESPSTKIVWLHYRKKQMLVMGGHGNAFKNTCVSILTSSQNIPIPAQ